MNNLEKALLEDNEDLNGYLDNVSAESFRQDIAHLPSKPLEHVTPRDIFAAAALNAILVNPDIGNRYACRCDSAKSIAGLAANIADDLCEKLLNAG